jgi:hypothetical protein
MPFREEILSLFVFCLALAAFDQTSEARQFLNGLRTMLAGKGFDLQGDLVRCALGAPTPALSWS